MKKREHLDGQISKEGDRQKRWSPRQRGVQSGRQANRHV